MKTAKSVNEYIARSPKAAQARLRAVRAAIKSAAPKAEESVSYGMPYYAYKGRLAYFGLFKRHIGLYVPRVVGQHKRELKGFVMTNATVRLPLDRKLPVAVIKKLVRARVKMNEATK